MSPKYLNFTDFFQFPPHHSCFPTPNNSNQARFMARKKCQRFSDANRVCCVFRASINIGAGNSSKMILLRRVDTRRRRFGNGDAQEIKLASSWRRQTKRWWNNLWQLKSRLLTKKISPPPRIWTSKLSTILGLIIPKFVNPNVSPFPASRPTCAKLIAPFVCRAGDNQLLQLAMFGLKSNQRLNLC